METIAVFDVNFHGHHPTYLKLISKALLDNNYRVWLFCQEANDVKTWLQQNIRENRIKNLRAFTLSSVPSRGIFSPISWGLRNWKYASNYIKTLAREEHYQPDLVFFPKVDDYTPGVLSGRWVDYVFPYSWSGLFIHQRVQNKYDLKSFIRRSLQPLSAFTAHRCKSIGVLQEDCIVKLQSAVKKPIFEFPDVTDESPPSHTDLTKRIIEIARGRKIIGLIGGQDKRKGSFTLLEVARRCKNKDWFFIFVGKMNYYRSDRELDQLKRIIGNRKEWDNCFFHFKRIPDEGEFNALINLCDIIFAAYHNFCHSSNIMTKAALFKKPVLVSSGKLMEKRVKSFGIGLSCKEGDVKDCIRKISELIDNKLTSPGYSEYYHYHSKEKFIDRINLMIKCGLE